MSEVYVTLFDSVFIPQGLALYHSLLKHCSEFKLWVLCLDQACFDFLKSLQLDYLLLLNLSDFENDQLLSVKDSRSRSEYCWTLTSWSIQWVFESDPSAERVTYLDADTFFLNSPSPIFDEFDKSGKYFLITEHAYSPFHDQTSTSGRFCVQFVTVYRGQGQIVLSWWRDRCLGWCFARHENGLFGDQKYFELIASLFADLVYVVERQGYFLAPWNVALFRYSDAILFHFHGFRILSPKKYILSSYRLPLPALNFVYRPYVLLIKVYSSHILRFYLLLSHNFLFHYSSASNFYCSHQRFAI